MYKILAVIVFIISIIASYFIFKGGNYIGEIQSVGGRTLEEAYYNGLGLVYKGLSLFVLTTGIFFSSFLYRFSHDGKTSISIGNFSSLFSKFQINKSNILKGEDDKKENNIRPKIKKLLFIIIVIVTCSYIAYETINLFIDTFHYQSAVEDNIKATQEHMSVDVYRQFKRLTTKQKNMFNNLRVEKNMLPSEALAVVKEMIKSNRL
ncbi:MAG: hypothetical protein J6K16_04295 [Alphaproteobacteria bacterium]|nr:hypothetical protein [Alphaproteobacteria bacterium]